MVIMNKKGFTIIEILGVIVVLAAVMAIIIPNLTESSTKAKTRLYETKIRMIEKAAVLYAQDNYKDLISGETGTVVVKTINSDELISKKYLVADKENNEKKYLVDPRDGSELNVNIEITITLANKKITAKVK